MNLPDFDYKPKSYTGPSKAEVLEKRKKHINPAIFHYYKEPLMVVEGNMQYVFDETGRRYLDAFGGIVTVSVGHCHPKVTQAAIEQMKKIQHTTTIYLHSAISDYAEALANKMPGNLKVVYFVNSGSEANDLAILMARLYTGNYDIVALRNGYHGGNMSAMGLTAHGTWKYNVPHSFGVHHAMNANPYRGPWGYDNPDAADKYANEVDETIRYTTSGKVAGFISESIQGVGGSIVYPEGYLQKVYDITRKAGGVCIADEVQAGFGRTGSHFWGFETNKVMPDIVTMAKGIGNGAPLAAVVTTPEIAQTLAQKIHFNTYGGNPISSSIGKAVLDVIEEEGTQQNCAELGDYFIKSFNKLAEKHSIIGDVRGKGLMLGVEMVKDRKTKEPASQECTQIFEKTREKGLLIGKGGLDGNTLRIKPPMCINKKDAEFMVEVLDECFSEL